MQTFSDVIISVQTVQNCPKQLIPLTWMRLYLLCIRLKSLIFDKKKQIVTWISENL